MLIRLLILFILFVHFYYYYFFFSFCFSCFYLIYDKHCRFASKANDGRRKKQRVKDHFQKLIAIVAAKSSPIRKQNETKSDQWHRKNDNSFEFLSNSHIVCETNRNIHSIRRRDDNRRNEKEKKTKTTIL